MTHHRAGKRPRTKRSTLAGSWYPADAAVLNDLVDELLAEASAAQVASLLGLIVPHAGYRYSGVVAAAAYQRLRDVPCDRVVLLGPSHRQAFAGVAVLEGDAFETPLGLVPIDPVVREVAQSGLVCADATLFEDEHSLEIQLPFLQRVQPHAAVVPLLFGDLSAGDLSAVAAILTPLAGDRTVFVVSSDFTHYGRQFGYEPFPAQGAEQVRARLHDLDMGAIAPLLRSDVAAFQRHIAETGDTVCGHIPIAAFVFWLGSDHRGELLAYQTSLDVTGDYKHSVSYAAIGFPRE